MTQTNQAAETETLNKTTLSQAKQNVDDLAQSAEVAITRLTVAQRRAMYQELVSGRREITSF